MAITCTVACVPLARKSVNPASVPLPAKFHSKKVVQTSIYTRGAPLVTYGHCSFASKVVSSARQRGRALRATPEELQAQQIEEAMEAAQNAIPV
eukprot:1176177-Prorocentrum_minimum.AAC.2